MTPPAHSATEPGSPWQQAFDWIEETVGGRIRHFERQARWRPAFFLDVEREGETLPIYVRGARTEVPDNDSVLKFEHDIMVQLAKDGVPLPHIYGFCPQPAAIVMERSPGRENLGTADSREEAENVLDEYMEILARIHTLDTAPYEAMGMERREDAEALGLADLPKWEATFRRSKSRPEPAIEFVLAWLKRNVPQGRTRSAFLCGDSGQFLFEKGHLTTLIDLELALLGDPAADLGGMMGRDLSEPLGDLNRGFERYFEFSGERIPRSVIEYHAIRFNLNTSLATAPLVATPPPGIDLVQYLGWYWVWTGHTWRSWDTRSAWISPSPSFPSPRRRASRARTTRSLPVSSKRTGPAEISPRTRSTPPIATPHTCAGPSATGPSSNTRTSQPRADSSVEASRPGTKPTPPSKSWSPRAAPSATPSSPPSSTRGASDTKPCCSPCFGNSKDRRRRS